MKVVVINNSGNVGKTTICQNMLLPRINDVEIIRVESLNDDNESTGQKLGADLFDEIFESIVSKDNVIVDVGSSNVEMFNNKLKNEFAGSHSFIDIFIVPVTPDEKQQRDTIATIAFLLDMGVENEKIKVIFNRANPKKTIESQFSTLIKSEVLKDFSYKFDSNPIPIINSTLFETLKKANISYELIKSIKNDSLDNDLEKETDKTKKTKLNMLKFYKMGFDSYQKNLQAVFDSLNIQQ